MQSIKSFLGYVKHCSGYNSTVSILDSIIFRNKNNDICCSPTFEVRYCIWHVRPATFFEFDRPEMCEVDAVE